MVKFERFVFPVGQGGFAFERIADYSVVFDCGSTTSPARVKQYINSLKSKVSGKIDRIYLSHFDKDHVNSIKELIDTIGIDKAVIPYVPGEYRVAYDLVTGGAYSSIRDAFVNSQVELIEPEDENTKSKSMWEWIAKPMFDRTGWTALTNNFITNGIIVAQLNDPSYVESYKDTIKQCFEHAFTKKGVNAHGLILLSQKTGGTISNNEMTYNGITTKLTEKTAALYFGDADVNAKKRAKVVQGFLKRKLLHPLLFIQIPHHGSRYNSGPDFNIDFPASYYYYQDISSNRLQKNTVLYRALTITPGILLGVKDVDPDLIEHIVEIQ